jgi:ribosomal protein L11 methyltransferase
MDYVKITLKANIDEDFVFDTIFALLADDGFESFDNEGGERHAFCPVNLYDKACLDSLTERLPIDGLRIEYSEELIKDRDWNETWESENFTPISVDGRVSIHAPGQDCGEPEYDIVIEPRMSFGTGHHATTCMMLSFLLQENLKGKKVVDMGCGTAVLSILASKRGADSVLAVDIDEWAYRNAIDNVKLNGCDNVSVALGSDNLLTDNDFDIVLANINRNILLGGMEAYASSLKKGGMLFLSGFLEGDVEVLTECAAEHGLSLAEVKKNGEWRALKLIKN